LSVSFKAIALLFCELLKKNLETVGSTSAINLPGLVQTKRE